MIFAIVTLLVLAVLIYSYFEFVGVYGARTLLKLFALTAVFFFVKEHLQSHNNLLHHYYHVNHAIWITILGVPPFIVFGHLFVVLMTWQLAVMYLHRLKLTNDPAILITLIWYFTSAFSMLMENTGWVGGWWSWSMPSWWHFPNLFGAPLIDLPWDRPMTTAWGYFISTYWFVLLATDLPKPWTLKTLGIIVLGLAVSLALAPTAALMTTWAIVMAVLPFISVWRTRPADSSGPQPEKKLLMPLHSMLLVERKPRWNGAVFVGLLAMVLVCIAQITVSGKYLAYVSLYPIFMFAMGTYRKWPLWIDVAVSLAMMVVGYSLNNGNVVLAGWLVLRCSFVLWLLLAVVRWRSARVSSGAAPPVTAAATA